MRANNLTGQRFGRLFVLCLLSNQKHKRRWACRCDCGQFNIVVGEKLVSGKTRTCGCGRRKHGHSYFNGRKQTTPEYNSYRCMLGRCNEPRTANYKNYGGRGITVCERWNNFENFLADMGLKPSPKHTIDRLDSSGNYEPSNCRWATYKEQNDPSRKRKHG